MKKGREDKLNSILDKISKSGVDSLTDIEKRKLNNYGNDSFDIKQEIINEISGLDNIILKADRSVERGGCLLESANCTVDATISGQLQVIKEALQSAPESAPAAASFPGEP